MRSGEGGDSAEPNVRGIGPIWRRVYRANAGKRAAYDRGAVSREPKHGQEALDYSLPVKPTAPVRVGVDYDEGEYVVLRRHLRAFQEASQAEIFHGYVVAWSALPQECRNALMRAGMANLKGKIM